MKNRFLEGQRRKMVSQSTKDYFLLNDRIYPVSTMTQRAKLQSLKQFIEFQDEYKPPPTPIRRPTAPKINLKQQLSQLTLQQKKQIAAEIQNNLNIKSNPFLKRLEGELKSISNKIQQQADINRQMLFKLEKSGELTSTECQNKLEFFNKLYQRKQHFIQSVTRLFTNIFTKEYRNDQGEITLNELLYSHNSLSLLCSAQNIRSEEQLTSQKDLLIKEIAAKLDLVNTKSEPIKDKQKQKIFSLECEQVIPKLQLNIPLILTKDRKEEIEKEETAAQKKISQCEIEHRIATQLSLLVRIKTLDQTMVDTSLIAVGSYLSKLNTYILDNYFEDIIELINMPFGKPAIERLAELRGAFVGEDILPVILSEKLFDEFESKIQSNDYEKRHHRVLFDCLNQSLNIYRPFFNFKGEIYPWLTTEKGMTFYSISESNIEQVLDKCKISIMEKAATLCGVLSQNVLNQKTLKIYEEKRKDRIQRMTQQDVVEPNWLQTEDVQGKIMLQFSNNLIDWLIQETVHQLQCTTSK